MKNNPSDYGIIRSLMRFLKRLLGLVLLVLEILDKLKDLLK
jgi:hypothetical protein